MRIIELRLVRVRCFEDTGEISPATNCNIFVGKNNTGKSTLLRAVLRLQGFSFDDRDVRPSEHTSAPPFISLMVQQANWNTFISEPRVKADPLRIILPLGERSPSIDGYSHNIHPRKAVFHQTRPLHSIVPFVARRKAREFAYDVSLNAQSAVSGTLARLIRPADTHF